MKSAQSPLYSRSLLRAVLWRRRPLLLTPPLNITSNSSVSVYGHTGCRFQFVPYLWNLDDGLFRKTLISNRDEGNGKPIRLTCLYRRNTHHVNADNDIDGNLYFTITRRRKTKTYTKAVDDDTCTFTVPN